VPAASIALEVLAAGLLCPIVRGLHVRRVLGEHVGDLGEGLVAVEAVHLRVRGGEAGQAAEAMRCCLLASTT
jgi:hypothetical protein